MRILAGIILLGLLLGAQVSADDWQSLVTQRVQAHHDLLRANSVLAGIQEKLLRLDLPALPLGVTASSGESQTMELVSSLGLSVQGSMALWDTPEKKLQRNSLLAELKAAALGKSDLQRGLVVKGITLYWTMVLTAQRLEAADVESGLKSRINYRVKALWDQGQASLTDLNEAEQNLRQAQTNLSTAKKAARLSRLAWYLFLGQEDRGETWSDFPKTASVLPQEIQVSPYSLTAWQTSQDQYQLSLEKGRSEQSGTLPITLALSAKTLGNQEFSLGLDVSKGQGTLGWSGEVTTAPPQGEFWSWGLQVRYNPDLMNWIFPEKINQIAQDKALADWVETQNNLKTLAESKEADWEAALAELSASQGAMERAVSLDQNVKIKVAAGRALDLDAQESNLGIKKARLNLEAAKLALFAAADPTVDPWTLILKESSDEKSQ